MDVVAETMYATLSAFEVKSQEGLSGTWTWEVLGIAVELYEYVFRILFPPNTTFLKCISSKSQSTPDTKGG